MFRSFIFTLMVMTSAYVCGEDAVFVSLGSSCAPAVKLKTSGLRKAAFPLDWVLSVNTDAIIAMLDDDFKYFLDRRYLAYKNTLLINEYYQIEFSHEGVWRHDTLDKQLPKLKSKFKRRINRFRQLNDYPGKIFFVRGAWSLSTHPHYAFYSEDNLDIPESVAERLLAALQRCFPKADVYLLILNPEKENCPACTVSGRIAYIRDNGYDIRQAESLYD